MSLADPSVRLLPTVSPDAAVDGSAASTSGLSSAPGGIYAAFAKRLLDLLIVATVAGLVLPLVLVLLVIVAADGHSPIYGQDRLGRHGRVFRIWKLRTMVPDADRVLEAILSSDPEVRAEWDRHQKLRRDPRVTRVGAVLRKTSLDELPQLYNVLKGEMSIVGPRPMLPDQRDLYPGEDYFLLRPGITGLWQVSARHESSFAERARFDRRYAQSLSFRVDLAILLRTVRVVLTGTGC
ncbi:sugar transferase [Rubellimicrobium aerolatum]|uniref:Sugar transferase n=1 Tax=Rubellimicrobium aerolatum TaxID=490979 RepID=A0ABW0SDN9_9RHOB